MDIKITKVDKHDVSNFQYIAKWSNEPDIRYLLRPNFEEGELENVEPEQIQQSALKCEYKHIYLIWVDNKAVGEVSIMIDPPQVYNKTKGTSWIGICIGEKEYQGKGIAKKAMEFLEEESKRLGLSRIELGVFGNNPRAIEFYKKLGYKTIYEFEKFTYCEGKWYSDIRMEKTI